jgi:hypothetical protein
MEKGPVMDGRNAARRRWWVWAGAAAVGVPLAVFFALLAAVLIRAGVATAPQCAIALLNEARTAGVADQLHPRRVDRLGAALRFRTVSFDVGNQTHDQFPLLIQHLKDSELTNSWCPKLPTEPKSAFTPVLRFGANIQTREFTRFECFFGRIN